MTKVKKEILARQIWRLAKIYSSKPIDANNIDWHIRVCKIQAEVIQERKKLK